MKTGKNILWNMLLYIGVLITVSTITFSAFEVNSVAYNLLAIAVVLLAVAGTGSLANFLIKEK